MLLSLRRTPVTCLLLAGIGGGFLLESWAGGSTRPDVLVRLGANVAVLVRQGEWWRLLASMFLHIGLAHLLLNAWALYQLGALFEIWLGSSRLLLVYFGSGVVASLTSVLWRGEGLSAGASGAIFGVLGALVAFLLRRRDRLTGAARQLLVQLVIWAGINVVFGLTNPGIDNAAHLGGGVAGLALGGILRSPRERG